MLLVGMVILLLVRLLMSRPLVWVVLLIVRWIGRA